MNIAIEHAMLDSLDRHAKWQQNLIEQLLSQGQNELPHAIVGGADVDEMGEIKSDLAATKLALSTAEEEITQLRLALDDACNLCNEYQDQLNEAKYQDGRPILNAGNVRSLAIAVSSQIMKATEHFSNGADDDAMEALGRASAHSQSLIDYLNAAEGE